MFPGVLGIDITKETDRAIKSLKGTKCLIVDLRGNLGSAGAGNLRLMSYLTPDKIPVGYSLTRRRAEQGYKREELIRFERVPSSKLLAPFALWRFRNVDKSIVVVTEGLGRQSFHGKTVMLVNEHTISGAEIVAGFAADHKLAVVVGTRTAGRMLSWSPLPLGHGYFMTIPIGNYLTWEGKSFEGTGITPDVEVPFSPDAALEGRDQQLETAREIAKSL
jgi:C-terminal processing protease CtpA/Prc